VPIKAYLKHIHLNKELVDTSEYHFFKLLLNRVVSTLFSAATNSILTTKRIYK